MTNINPDIVLYHSTPAKNVNYIKNRGLISNLETRVVTDFNAETYLRDELGWTEEEIEDAKAEEDYWDDVIGEVPEINGRLGLNYHLPIQENAIFFLKEKPDRLLSKDITVLKINAKDIPCRCLEANSLYSDIIFEAYANELGDGGILEAIEEYNQSLRVLDTVPNEYPTEVLCHCDIPPEAIEF